MKILNFVFLLMLSALLYPETLFEVKDASDNTVLDVSTDGIRVLNYPDTLMVISADAIKANISSSKGLSRSFSVTTTQSKGKGLINALEIASDYASMSSSNGHYTNFSPENIFVGLNSGINTVPVSSTSGENNVFVGNESGRSNTSGASNVFIGYQSGYSNQTGYNNCFMGLESGYTNYSGRYNVFVGNKAGRANYDGEFNVFMGYNAGNMNSSGDRNVFIGYESGLVNTSGWGNTFVGEASGTSNGAGFGNSYFGRNAGFSNTDGDYNTCSGSDAGSSNASGNYNSNFGAESGMYNYTGSSNSTFGYQAGRGYSSYTYNNNSFFGFRSGYSTRTGSNNTYLGYNSGYSNITGSGNVFLGYQAGYSETGSYKLYIDNSSTSSPLIYGDFDSDWVKINGDFDVTSLATVGSLDVNGSANLNYGVSVNEFSSDGTMAGNSDSAVPTEKAVRTYISSYVSANGDNLGNHTATQNIKLNGYYLSNDGGSEGVFVDTGGDVGIGTGSPGNNRLKVAGINSGITGAAGYFENTNSLGIGLVAYATSTDCAFYAEQKNTSSTTANIAKFASMYGGSWHESVVFRNSGAIYANNLSSGTGTYLVLTSGNEIVKYSSSRKYKKDIISLEVDKEKFMKLRPVDFVWNEKSATEGKKDKGLIAEEVVEIDPELAVYNADGSVEGVDYHKMNIILLKVVQDQERKISDLESELKEIKKILKIDK